MPASWRRMRTGAIRCILAEPLSYPHVFLNVHGPTRPARRRSMSLPCAMRNDGHGPRGHTVTRAPSDFVPPDRARLPCTTVDLLFDAREDRPHGTASGSGCRLLDRDRCARKRDPHDGGVGGWWSPMMVRPTAPQQGARHGGDPVHTSAGPDMPQRLGGRAETGGDELLHLGGVALRMAGHRRRT